MWDLVLSVPDHCLSFYFLKLICINVGKFHPGLARDS